MRAWRIAGLIVLGWYLLLAVLHLFSLRPLWNDENAILYNMTILTPGEFFTRMFHRDQVFPRVYFWLIHCVSEPFQYSVLSLRSLPFVSMLGGIIVWQGLAARELKQGRLFFLFLLSWAASVPLVYYAAELKQYSMDLFVSALFLLFIARQNELLSRKGWRVNVLLAGMPFLGLLSYPAFLFLVFPLRTLILDLRRKEGAGLSLFIYLLACAAAVAVSFIFDMRLRPEGAVTGYHDYFISFASPADFLRTFGEGVNNLVGRWFGSSPKWIRGFARFFLAMGVVEIVLGLWGRKTGKAVAGVWLHGVAAVVFLELVLLGAFHKYPFIVPRTVLFFCPILFLLTMKFFERIERRSASLAIVLQSVYGGFLLFFVVRITLALAGGSFGNF